MNTSMKRIIGLIAVGVMLALTGLIGYKVGTNNTQAVASTNSAKEVAASFVSAMTSGNTTRAYGLGSAFYKAKNKPEDLQAITDKLSADNVKISDEELYFGRDNVEGQAIYLAVVDNLPRSSVSGKTTGNFIVRLVYEGGFWRVDSLQVS